MQEQQPQQLTKSAVRDLLRAERHPETRDRRVLFGSEDIGRIVRYGKRTGLSQKTVKTVYGSRIYGKYGRIEEEAGSERVLLDKVAAAIAKYLKAKAPSGPESGNLEASSSDEADPSVSGLKMG